MFGDEQGTFRCWRWWWLSHPRPPNTVTRAFPAGPIWAKLPSEPPLPLPLSEILTSWQVRGGLPTAWAQHNLFLIEQTEMLSIWQRHTISGLNICGVFFYCSIIAFQHCVTFHCTTKWTSYMYTYTSFLLNLPTNPHRPTPLGHHRAPSWAPCAYSSFPLALCLHRVVCICQSKSPSSSHPTPLPPLCPHIQSLRLHLCSCPGTRFIYTIFLDPTYRHDRWYMYRVCHTEWSKSKSGYVHLNNNLLLSIGQKPKFP